MSSLSGFIAGVFGLLLMVALTLTVVYWQEKKLRRAKVLGLISFACAVVTVIAYAFQYLSPAAQPIVHAIGPPEKSYVYIKDSKMEELIAGKSPVVLFLLQNGPTETTVIFSDVSYGFIRVLPAKYLRYSKRGIDRTLKLVPRQDITGKWTNPDFVLTQAQIDELNAAPPKAELYFYARGEYTDETGKHRFDPCWKYEKDFPGHLVFCAGDIKIE